MRVLIIDDEPLARRGVRVCLNAATDVTVVGECASGPEGVEQILELFPDLVFLDIQMPGWSGFDVLERIPAARRPLVIFLTAHDRYAVKAFEAQVVDYVLKPIDDQRFAAALGAARQRLRERRADSLVEPLRAAFRESPHEAGEAPGYRERFAVKLGSRTQVVSVDQVDWLEAEGDYVSLHVGNKTHLVRETLHSIERQLDPKHFARIHRSTIVAIAQIAEWHSLSSRDYLIRLRNGTELRASRRYRELLQGFR